MEISTFTSLLLVDLLSFLDRMWLTWSSSPHSPGPPAVLRPNSDQDLLLNRTVLSNRARKHDCLTWAVLPATGIGLQPQTHIRSITCMVRLRRRAAIGPIGGRACGPQRQPKRSSRRANGG